MVTPGKRQSDLDTCTAGLSPTSNHNISSLTLTSPTSSSGAPASPQDSPSTSSNKKHCTPEPGPASPPLSPGVAYLRLPSAGSSSHNRLPSAGSCNRNTSPTSPSAPTVTRTHPAPLTTIGSSSSSGQLPAAASQPSEEDLPEPGARTFSAPSIKGLLRSPQIGKSLGSPSASVPALPAPWAETGSETTASTHPGSVHAPPQGDSSKATAFSSPQSQHRPLSTFSRGGASRLPNRISMAYQAVPEDRPLSDGSDTEAANAPWLQGAEEGAALPHPQLQHAGESSGLLQRSAGQRYTRGASPAQAAAAAAAAQAHSSGQPGEGFNPFTEEEEKWLESVRHNQLRAKERLNVGLNYMGPGDVSFGGLGSNVPNMRGMSMRYAIAPYGGTVLSRQATLRNAGVQSYLERTATHHHHHQGTALNHKVPDRHTSTDTSDVSDGGTSPKGAGFGRSGTRRGGTRSQRRAAASASAAQAPGLFPGTGSPTRHSMHFKGRMSHLNPKRSNDTSPVQSRPNSSAALNRLPELEQQQQQQAAALGAGQLSELVQVPTLAMAAPAASSQPGSSTSVTAAATTLAAAAAAMEEQPSVFSKHAKALFQAESPPTPTAMRFADVGRLSMVEEGQTPRDDDGTPHSLQVDVTAPTPSSLGPGSLVSPVAISPFASVANVRLGGSGQPPRLQLPAQQQEGVQSGGMQGDGQAPAAQRGPPKLVLPHDAVQAQVGSTSAADKQSPPKLQLPAGMPPKPRVRINVPGADAAAEGADAAPPSRAIRHRRSGSSQQTSPIGSSNGLASLDPTFHANGAPHLQASPPVSPHAAFEAAAGSSTTLMKRISRRTAGGKSTHFSVAGSRVASYRFNQQASFLREPSRRQQLGPPGGLFSALGLNNGGLALQVGSFMERGMWGTDGQFQCAGDEDDVGVYIPPGLQQILPDDLVKVRELGRGCFGSVWLALWCGVEVALKELHQSVLTDSQQAEVFLEAERLAALRHPCVIAFYGIITSSPDSYGTVVEYVHMGSLRCGLHKLRAQGSVSMRTRAAIALQAARGMEYLHFQGVVHFDLKCENLLCDLRDIRKPIVKIADLGLSKLKQGKSSIKGKMLGTLPWMAPELFPGGGSTSLRHQQQQRQPSGSPALDGGDDGRLPWLESGAPAPMDMTLPRSRRHSDAQSDEADEYVTEKVDVYSFGVCLWEVWTLGQLPYQGWQPAELRLAIMNGTVRPDIPPDCDPLWVELMQDCWAARPADRPSFTEVAFRLGHMVALYEQQPDPRPPEQAASATTITMGVPAPAAGVSSNGGAAGAHTTMPPTGMHTTLGTTLAEPMNVESMGGSGMSINTTTTSNPYVTNASSLHGAPQHVVAGKHHLPAPLVLPAASPAGGHIPLAATGAPLAQEPSGEQHAWAATGTKAETNGHTPSLHVPSPIDILAAASGLSGYTASSLGLGRMDSQPSLESSAAPTGKEQVASWRSKSSTFGKALAASFREAAARLTKGPSLRQRQRSVSLGDPHAADHAAMAAAAAAVAAAASAQVAASST